MASSWLKSSLSGSSVALLFWWQSLTPTLIPRAWETQAVVSAVCLAVGFGIGTLAGRWAHRLREWTGRSTGNAIRRRGWIVLGTVWLVSVLLGATLWRRWQGEQRHIMGMASLARFDAALIGVVSPLAGLFLVVSGRVIFNGVAASTRFIERQLGVVTALVTAVLIVLLSILIGRGVVLRALTAAAYYRYAPANDQLAEGILPPDSSSVSGSRNSFVAWDTWDAWAATSWQR